MLVSLLVVYNIFLTGHNLHIVLISDSLKKECPGVTTICVELSKWSDAQAAAESAGDVDILVNNAAVYCPVSLLEATEEAYDATFSTNVAAVLSVSQVVAKRMIKKKQGEFFTPLPSIPSIFL